MWHLSLSYTRLCAQCCSSWPAHAACFSLLQVACFLLILRSTCMCCAHEFFCGLHVCRSACLPACLSVSVCLSVYMSICLSVCLSVCRSLCVCIVHVCLSIGLSLHFVPVNITCTKPCKVYSLASTTHTGYEQVSPRRFPGRTQLLYAAQQTHSSTKTCARETLWHGPPTWAG